MNLAELKKTSNNNSTPNTRRRINSAELPTRNFTRNARSLDALGNNDIDDKAFVSSPNVKTEKRKRKFFFWRHKIFALFLILLILSGVFYFHQYYQLKKTGLQLGFLDPFKGAINAISPTNNNALSKLEKTDGRTNVLLIGVDARSYNESYLTDSIMLMSYDHETKTTAQISFPRDLQVKYTINNRTYNAKLNSVFPNTYAQTKSFDDAFENLGNALEEISGLKLHYGVLINFRGFQQIIDSLGGITVDVENSFTDYEFPRNDDKGLITVSFKKGVQEMNGDKALQYARSRHSLDNGEGSDFSRARRQQKVIAAIKEKITSSNLFSKVDAFNNIINSLQDNIRFYNIGGNEINAGVKSRDILKDVQMYSMVLDPTFGGSTNAILTGKTWSDLEGYQVRPNSGNYNELKDKVSFYLKNYFLLSEKAQFELVWTNPQRFNDYIAIKKAFFNNGLDFNFNDPVVRIKQVSTASETTTTPTESLKSAQVKGVTSDINLSVYKLTEDKNKSFDYYSKILKENGINLVVKNSTDLPQELQKLKEGNDFILAVD